MWDPFCPRAHAILSPHMCGAHLAERGTLELGRQFKLMSHAILCCICTQPLQRIIVARCAYLYVKHFHTSENGTVKVCALNYATHNGGALIIVMISILSCFSVHVITSQIVTYAARWVMFCGSVRFWILFLQEKYSAKGNAIH